MVDFSDYNYDICGDEMSIDDLRKVQLEMLNALVNFCEQHNIRYYLSGGTLLGAIRHKGFIPWDDDIDVNIPRPDCIKLQKLSKGKIGEYILLSPTPIKGCFGESWRMYNPNTILESSMGKTTKYHVFHPVFIDIFPIEGLPNTKKKAIRRYKLITLARYFERTAFLDHPLQTGKNIYAKMFHALILPIAKGMGYEKWYYIVQKIASKYSFDESEYVGVMTAPVHKIEERVKKSEYIPTVQVQFENRFYSAPKNYETYLSQLYGTNYMKLPPENKRQSHHDFKAYWKKEEQK